MKVKILVACVVPGEDVKAGDVVDVPEPIAQRLIGMGRAVEFTEPARVPLPETIQTREPAVEMRDPETQPQKPVRRKSSSPEA